jgi:single-stranded-DNA-specific exonuclease
MSFHRKTITRRAALPLSSHLAQFHPVLQRVYSARNIQSPKELDYALQHLLHFETLQGICQAATLLAAAVIQQKRILIVGDFDTDGATSTALAVSALQAMGAQQVDYFIPNRFEYGYGLSPEIVVIAQQREIDLLVTVDNGISSYEGVSAAKAAGIQVIITDHHLLPTRLPPADAIVNPQQPEDQFASKALAGVGVIFYVMLALRERLQQQNWFHQQSLQRPRMSQFLDLVALGTVADMVPLDRNNRILVHQGLQQCRLGKARPGIRLLAQVAACDIRYIVSQDLGLRLAPRLNAAGRLSDMSLGVACLLAPNESIALDLAQQLHHLNKERREIDQTMQQQAWTILNRLTIPSQQAGICLFDPSWHQGVIGLVANRVKDQFYCPTIVFAPSNQADEIKGSARSIPGLHIRDILAEIDRRFPHLIRRFGGHAMAAGLTLAKAQYPDFIEAFNQTVQQHRDVHTLKNTLETDGELCLADFTPKMAEMLRETSPWGQGFPEPLFDNRFIVLDQQVVGQHHLRLSLALTQGHRPFKAMLFHADLKQWPNRRIQQIHAAFRLNLNHWEGRKEVQLVLEGVQNLSSDDL